ncbi:MAG: hypothetical protein CMP62_01695 [Flavobacteriales bacterium]|nr:hypothetical protein [Flavobacteriales bacterium]
MSYTNIKITYFILCIIIMGCTKNETTFHQDIKYIIHEKCAVCHHPKGAGPFSLITYQDLIKRADMIKEVIEAKYMPPWPADPEYRSFLYEKSLTPDEIEKITIWLNGKQQKGEWTNNSFLDSLLVKDEKRKPDLQLTMKQSHITNSTNQDQFLMMKFPFELEKDTFIRQIEFVPGNTQIVHHINAHLITYSSTEKTNLFDGEYIVDTELFSDEACFKKLNILNDSGEYPVLTPSVSNYLPGSEQTIYPTGIGGFTAKKQNIILVNDFHYAPTPYSVKDSSYFNIYFSKHPPKRKIQETQLGTFGISKINPPLIIPPNEIKKFTTRARITKDISLLTINPHMHLLGKSFLAYAVTINDDTIPLIKIDDWNFRWQYFYTFKKMLKIPAGSEIIVEATYDNTSNNPDNPFSPPTTVSERVNFNGRGSMKTSNEMLQFIINYLPYEEGDEDIHLGI